MNKRKIINLLVVLLIVLSNYNANATPIDTIQKNNILISIKGGLTNSTVYGSMVDRNQRFSEGKVTMTNKKSFAINLDIEKPFSFFYLKSGLNLIRKQVNPEENSSSYYKDELKTTYLTVPIVIGFDFFDKRNPLNFSTELGPAANIRLIDNSFFGPDIAAVKINPISLSLTIGTKLSYKLTSKLNLLAHYQYAYDISNSYVQTLYWGSYEEPLKDFTYKYKTNIFSFGFQFRI